MFANCKGRRRSGLWVEERYGEEVSPALRAYRNARMDLADSSATLPSGDVIATHTVSAKEYQVVMNAHSSGHIKGTIPTYTYWRPFAAGAANQRILDLFNASGSGKKVKCRKLFLHHNGAVVTGVSCLFDVIHTTAVGTAGTVITGQKVDSTDAAIPAQVTARSSATGGATESFVRFGFSVDTEETRAGTQIAPGINWLPEGEDIGDITLNEGEGILIKQITSTTVGIWGCHLVVSMI